jgi:hypothetical protein
MLLEQVLLAGSTIVLGMSLRRETRAKVHVKVTRQEPAKVKPTKKARRTLGGYYDDPIVNKDRGNW